MRFNSVKFKISVLYTAILGVVLVSYSTFLYLSLYYVLYDELDGELERKSQEMASTIDSYVTALGRNARSFNFAIKRVITLEGEYFDEAKISSLEYQWLQKIDKFNLKEDHINFLNIKGESLVRSPNLQATLAPLSVKEMTRLKNGEAFFKNIKFEKRHFRIMNIPFFYGDDELYMIQIGTSLKPIIRLLKTRLTHIVISIPIFLLFASFLGRIFASRILKPVMEITKTASKITHEDLSARVKAEHADEEMKYLVASFNDMISRLEQSFNYIAEFSSQVAHDLKTPLAIIRGESDIALRKDRSLAEYRRTIRVNLEETERMLKVIDNLLLLTKLDYRPELFKLEQVDLAEFLWAISEQSKILASQKEIMVNTNLPKANITVDADRLHLRRLFLNLIDNAIKFSNKYGKIDINTECENAKVVVSIADNGIGISEEDLPKIFDKHFHINRTDDQSNIGTGLGLSIAQSIAKIHKGHIKVKSVLGKGSVFSVTLPLR